MAVKPDKCAILQETVNQIRRIKAAEELAVQQGEVSSSTNILANEILCPLVLEALDGFLFVVNSDGIVEFCSENVEGFVGFKGEELVGKSIYGVVHSSDQARFSGSLLPMSIGELLVFNRVFLGFSLINCVSRVDPIKQHHPDPHAPWNIHLPLNPPLYIIHYVRPNHLPHHTNALHFIHHTKTHPPTTALLQHPLASKIPRGCLRLQLREHANHGHVNAPSDGEQRVRILRVLFSLHSEEAAAE